MAVFPLVFPHGHSMSRPAAEFKSEPEDFQVNEMLGFELTGSGEHLWLQIEKTGLNTMDVVHSLGKQAGVRDREVGYSGLKDKQAVTTQWFSLPVTDDAFVKSLETNQVKIKQVQRNAKKLRRGLHRGNVFTVRLRNSTLNTDQVAQFSDLVARQGVPNYFGLQRFGFSGSNLEQAQTLFETGNGSEQRKRGRQRQGMLLSAARAYLFNQVLAKRVSLGNWNKWLVGDVMNLAGSDSVFLAEEGDAEISVRLEQLDIHPTGPLWGSGELLTRKEARELESEVAREFNDFAEGLEQFGLKQERRPLRLVPENLRLSSAENGELVVEFGLPKGAYATSVLRELVTADEL